MLLEMNHSKDALAEYERSLNRSESFQRTVRRGARRKLANQPQKAPEYYAQLLKNCDTTSERTELARARTVLARR
jgi:hypothetical protein